MCKIIINVKQKFFLKFVCSDGSPKSNILEQFSTSENVTELRYQTSDISNAHIYEVGLPEEATNLLLTSIKEPNAQFDDQSYMCPIPESLDDPLISEIIPEINQPDSTANAIKSNKKAVEKDDEIQESIQNEHLNIVIDGKFLFQFYLCSVIFSKAN